MSSCTAWQRKRRQPPLKTTSPYYPTQHFQQAPGRRRTHACTVILNCAVAGDCPPLTTCTLVVHAPA